MRRSVGAGRPSVRGSGRAEGFAASRGVFPWRCCGVFGGRAAVGYNGREITTARFRERALHTRGAGHDQRTQGARGAPFAVFPRLHAGRVRARIGPHHPACQRMARERVGPPGPGQGRLGLPGGGAGGNVAAGVLRHQPLPRLRPRQREEARRDAGGHLHSERTLSDQVPDREVRPPAQPRDLPVAPCGHGVLELPARRRARNPPYQRLSDGRQRREPGRAVARRPCEGPFVRSHRADRAGGGGHAAAEGAGAQGPEGLAGQARRRVLGPWLRRTRAGDGRAGERRRRGRAGGIGGNEARRRRRAHRRREAPARQVDREAPRGAASRRRAGRGRGRLRAGRRRQCA